MVFSNIVTTVSPTYAQEVRTSEVLMLNASAAPRLVAYFIDLSSKLQKHFYLILSSLLLCYLESFTPYVIYTWSRMVYFLL